MFEGRIYQLKGDEYKKDRADVQLKVGQLEAKILADQYALGIFTSIDLNDPALYVPVQE